MIFSAYISEPYEFQMISKLQAGYLVLTRYNVFYLLYLHPGDIMDHSTLRDCRSTIWRPSHRWLW